MKKADYDKLKEHFAAMHAILLPYEYDAVLDWATQEFMAELEVAEDDLEKVKVDG